MMRMSDWSAEECTASYPREEPITGRESEDGCPYDDCVVHCGGSCTSVGRLKGRRDRRTRPVDKENKAGVGGDNVALDPITYCAL